MKIPPISTISLIRLVFFSPIILVLALFVKKGCLPQLHIPQSIISSGLFIYFGLIIRGLSLLNRRPGLPSIYYSPIKDQEIQRILETICYILVFIGAFHTQLEHFLKVHFHITF